MKITKPLIIILLLGIFTGYFFITSALPVGLLCVPVCLFFFKFPKEKLSAHINFFGFVSTVFGLILFHETLFENFKAVLFYFIAIIVLSLLGKIIKKTLPTPIQISGIIYWILLLITFLVLTTAPTPLNPIFKRALKIISCVVAGALGIPTAPLLSPTMSFAGDNIFICLVALMLSGLPAIIINLIKDFKPKYIDYKFSAYYIIFLIVGIVLGLCVINLDQIYSIDIVWKLSIFLPSLILLGFTIYNTNKSLKKLKGKK